MLKSTDLRIGNVVNFHSDDTIFEVLEIDRLGLRVKNEEQETWIEYDCFSGIPLTAEWLERFGFVPALEGAITQLLPIAYQDENFTCTLQASNLDDGISICRAGLYSIKPKTIYVHQLQNLYHALTGEELTIKK